MERTQRISNSAQTSIVKFLGYRGNERVLRAARLKGQVMYKDNVIRFHQDFCSASNKGALMAFGKKCMRKVLPSIRLYVQVDVS